MAKSRIGASYWQLIPTLEGLEKAISEEMKNSTQDGYAVPVEAKVDNDAMDVEMGKSGDKSGKLFGDKFKVAFIASGAILAVTALAGKALYDIGDQFDGIGDDIQITTGKTGAELDALNESAKNVFTSIPTNTEAASGAIAKLSQRLGYTGEELETVTKQILEAGRMQGVDVDVNNLADAFLQFGINAEGAESALDGAFAASQKSGTSLDDILSKVAGSSAQLKGLNLSFDESVNLISSLSAAGVDVESTLAQMGKGIVNFAKDGQPANEAIKGVVGEIQALISAGKEAEAIDVASQVFGSKGALNIVNAIETGAVSVESFNANMGELNNTILGTAEDTNDFAEKWQVLQNKGMEALEPLGTAVLELATSLLEDAGPAIDFLIDAVSNLAIFFAENEWAIAGVAALIGGALVTAFVAATAAAWAFVAPILANPITWVILAAVAAIALLVAAFVWLTENWDAVMKFFGDSIQNIGAFFTSLGEGIVAFFSGIGNFIMGMFMSLVEFVLGIANTVIDIINNILTFIPNLLGFNVPGIVPNVGIPQMADGGTVLPTSGGTLAVLAEAGKPETVVDTGNMNQLIEGVLNGSIGNGASGAPVINIYITQKDDQSMRDFIEQLTKEIQFQLTGGGEYSYA